MTVMVIMATVIMVMTMVVVMVVGHGCGAYGGEGILDKLASSTNVGECIILRIFTLTQHTHMVYSNPKAVSVLQDGSLFLFHGGRSSCNPVYGQR